MVSLFCKEKKKKKKENVNKYNETLHLSLTTNILSIGAARSDQTVQKRSDGSWEQSDQGLHCLLLNLHLLDTLMHC